MGGSKGIPGFVNGGPVTFANMQTLSSVAWADIRVETEHAFGVSCGKTVVYNQLRFPGILFKRAIIKLKDVWVYLDGYRRDLWL